jgi:glycosyltransferase involved in cell wall biosynthesis
MSVSITVVIPNYNHAEYIRSAIEAVLQQTTDPDEIIIIDDASTDNSWDIVNEYKGHYLVSCYRNSENKGVVETLNSGLYMAKSDFVLFAASDDIIKKKFIEICKDVLDKNPEAGLCSTLSDVIDTDGKELGVIRSPVVSKKPTYLTPLQCQKKLWREGSWLMGNSVLFNTAYLREIGGYKKKLGSYSDNLACQLLALQHGVIFVPKILVSWRRLTTGHAVSTALNVNKSIALLEQARQFMLIEYPEYFDKKYVKLCINRFRFDVVDTFVRDKPDILADNINRLADMNTAVTSWLLHLPVIGRKVTILYFFIKLRARDIFFFLRRRLLWLYPQKYYV